ncbi:hypothetical protein GOQ30_05220 [Flavobacterium sp. TP390]|uniref:Lipocalin-like domain-containing protein n=1 Tax=Flavobacterium profundi TaxID=1774945 RepID=A0A6I4IKF1_9FLAO|nr:hypothetical protein [Flavobacterium profundi]MVO08561.1 hypothetical protein [Flavobacterium profundi]
MKKTFYFLVFISLVFFTNCSSDDNSSNQNNETYQKLIGKWYFDDPSTNPSVNNSFKFTSNGNVIYSYWTGTGNEYDNETGTFSVSNDIMTMTFPENVSLTFVQKVVFINNDKVEFLATGSPSEEAYEGDYFRD